MQLMVGGQLRPIEGAQVHSVENDNSRFAIVIWTQGPADMEQLLGSVLVGGEIEISCNGGSSGTDLAQHWFMAERDLALEVASSLGVLPLERVEPELDLELTLYVHSTVTTADGGLPATVRITNNGAQAVAFGTGSRWAASGRDNRFDFQATRAGLSLPGPPADYDFGGLGSSVQLAPVEYWETEVDLADWFPVRGPGVYRVEARFELDLEDFDTGPRGVGWAGPGPLWSGELRGVYPFELK